MATISMDAALAKLYNAARVVLESGNRAGTLGPSEKAWQELENAAKIAEHFVTETIHSPLREDYNATRLYRA